MTIEQLQEMICRPGARKGYAMLLVDLTELGELSVMLEALKQRGYTPEIRYIQFTTGLHIVAVLKDEWVKDDTHYEALEEEWLSLCTELTPNDLNKAFRLWRRHPNPVQTAA